MPGSLHTNARAIALSRFAREDVECLCYKSKVASIFKHFGGACDQRTCSKPCLGLLSSLTLNNRTLNISGFAYHEMGKLLLLVDLINVEEPHRQQGSRFMHNGRWFIHPVY